MNLIGLLQIIVWFALIPCTVAVDVVRAILHPRTFEESLCIYVVAGFIGGWVALLTFVFSYWLYYRVPVPQYTYELVTGASIQTTPDKTSGSAELDRGNGSPNDNRSHHAVEAHPNQQQSVYAEQATQQVTLETPKSKSTQKDEYALH